MSLLKRFTWNGTPAPAWLLINKISRQKGPPQKAKLLEIMGRRGAYYFGKSEEVRTSEIACTIMADNDPDLWQKIEWLNGWLDSSDEIGTLEFNDEPNRRYKAFYLNDSADLESQAALGAISLTFISPDPYKEGNVYNTELGSGTEIFNLENQGNAPYYPVFTIDFTKDQDFISVIGPDNFVMYGMPRGIDETPVKPEELIFTDVMDDLVPWSNSGVIVEYGVAAGGFKVVGTGQEAYFVPANYGGDTAPSNNWHGPVVKRTIPGGPLQDFKVEAAITLNSTKENTGRMEMNLLDTNNVIFAKLVLWDRYPAGEMNTGHIYAGNSADNERLIWNMGVPNMYSWNDFYGHIKLKRIGNEWSAAIVQTESDGRYKEETHLFKKRIINGYQNQLAQIQIGAMVYGTTGAAEMRYRNFRIYKENDVSAVENGVPSLFQAGDQLVIDFKKGAAFLNGEYFNQFLDPQSRFFGLKPGTTDLIIRTTDNSGLSANVEYTEVFK